MPPVRPAGARLNRPKTADPLPDIAAWNAPALPQRADDPRDFRMMGRDGILQIV